MAIELPRGLYTGGAVEFDTNKGINVYAQLMAKKQARDQALDEYYQKLHTSINPQGMRAKDIDGGFSNKVGEWQKFWMDNKERIKNPKTIEDRKLANEHIARFQDLNMDIERSKEAAKQELELGKKKLSGEWNPTNEDLKVANALGSTIYSDDYYKDPGVRTKPFTLNDISLYVPEFDPKAQESFYKGAVGEAKARKTYDEKSVRKDAKSGQVIIPYEEKYSNEDIRKIGDRAASLAVGSKSAMRHYERLMEDEGFFTQADQAFKSVYGKDAQMDSPEKAAQAAAIMNARSMVNRGEELRADEEARQQNRIQLINIRDSLKDSGSVSESKINDIYNQIDEMATQKANEKRSHLQVNLLPSDAQGVVIDAARKMVGDNTIGQDDIKIIKRDGKIGIYLSDRYESDSEALKPNQLVGYLTQTGTNIKSQPGIKEKREVIKKGNQPAPKTKKDPLGLGL